MGNMIKVAAFGPAVAAMTVLGYPPMDAKAAV